MAGKDSQFAIEVILKAVDRITQPLKSTTTRFGRALKKLKAHTRQLTQAFRTLDRWISRAVTVTAFAAFYMLQRAIRSGVSALLDFDQSMMRMLSKMPGEIGRGTAAFKGMRREMLNALRGTEFGPQSVAKAMDTLKLANFSYAESLGLLKPIADFATAAELDLGVAAGFAGDMLGAVGMRTNDAAQNVKNLTMLTDKMAVAVTNSNMTATDFFETIKTGGPAVMNLGGDLDFLLTASMALANAAQKGEMSGTQMKNIWVRFLTVTPKLLRRLKGQGIDPFVTDKRGRTALREGIGLLEMYKRAFKDMGERQKAVIMNALTGKRGIIGFSALLGTTTLSLKKYYALLENSTGASARMAQVIRSGLQLRLRRLGALFDRIKIKLLDLIEGPLVNGLNILDKWVDNLDRLIDQRPELFLDIFSRIGETLQTVGRTLLWVIGLWTVFKVVGLAVSVVTTALQLVLTFIFLLNMGLVGTTALLATIPVLIILAIMSIIGLILLLTGKLGTVRDSIAGAFEGFQESAGLNALIAQVGNLNTGVAGIDTGKIAAVAKATMAALPAEKPGRIPAYESKLPMWRYAASSLGLLFSGGMETWMSDMFAGRREGIATHARMSPQPFSQGRVIIEDRTGNARVESGSPEWLQLNPSAQSGAAQ